jgi:hypothetical protein
MSKLGSYIEESASRGFCGLLIAIAPYKTGPKYKTEKTPSKVVVAIGKNIFMSKAARNLEKAFHKGKIADGNTVEVTYEDTWRERIFGLGYSSYIYPGQITGTVKLMNIGGVKVAAPTDENGEPLIPTYTSWRIVTPTDSAEK